MARPSVPVTGAGDTEPDTQHGGTEQDQLTQANTQGDYDPRRMGLHNSGLSESDLADVVCILHPCSQAACRIVARTLLRTPQHVLQNEDFDNFDKDDGFSLSQLEERETFVLQQNTPQQALDLALRFSSKTVNPPSGFIFGRNPSQCDIVLDTDTVRRISNMHFRIYLNNSGVCMLQDTSTNGTMVDDVVLKGRITSEPQTRMLNSGSIIQILSQREDETVKFIVRIPSRDQYALDYTERFRSYMEGLVLAAARAKYDKRFGGPHAQKTRDLARAGPSNHPTSATAPIPRPVVNKNPWGMVWNGGEKYNVNGHLGKGAFASVYLLATKSGGEYYAAKELEKRRFMKNGVLDRKLENELNIMRSTSHANIVRYIEYFDYGAHLYIIMEYVPCGDLQQHLAANGKLTEYVGMVVSDQIFDALSYLHNNNITHRDIKPDNILIANNNPQDFWVKLSDFGLSKVVNHGETFLKTFCGTLLYCAPEVFPQYDAHASSRGKKRDRRGGPPQQARFHSYSQSVDIWSYGAVLWFSLCGKPPFEGVLDNTGRGMFERIMLTSLDPTPLFEHGISKVCINLLLRMLDTDPSARPSSNLCRQHLWFEPLGVTQNMDEPEESGLRPIDEEDEVTSPGAAPDLGQLSINEEDYGDDLGIGSDELDFLDLRMSKRIKSFNPNSRSSSSDRASALMKQQLDGPSSTEAGNARLFGEISQSALNSNSSVGYPVLPKQAHSAMKGSQQGPMASGLRGGGTSHASSDGIPRPDSFTTGGALGSASLLGAESLVRDLNMESPHSPGNSPSAEENEPQTPRTPAENGSALNASSVSASPEETPTRANEETPKQLPFRRHIDLPFSASAWYDPYDPRTHNVEYASSVSGHDFASAATISSSDLASLTAKRSASQESTSVKSSAKSSANPPAPALQPAVEFVRPPPRLGRLISTKDSFPDITINLLARTTTWGRAPGNNVIYEDKEDTRVPKRGIILMFNAPGIKEAENNGKDFTRLPGLHCTIATQSSKGIRINGVKLAATDSNDRCLWGRVYSGDLITIAQGGPSGDGGGGKGLAFVCEFYHGEGRARRSNDAALPPFVVQASK